MKHEKIYVVGFSSKLSKNIQQYCDQISSWMLYEYSNDGDLKWKSRTKITLFNSWEKRKISQAEIEKIMKIGKEIKLWMFEIFYISGKHFLTSKYKYSIDWGDDIISSKLITHMQMQVYIPVLKYVGIYIISDFCWVERM